MGNWKCEAVEGCDEELSGLCDMHAGTALRAENDALAARVKELEEDEASWERVATEQQDRAMCAESALKAEQEARRATSDLYDDALRQVLFHVKACVAAERVHRALVALVVKLGPEAADQLPLRGHETGRRREAGRAGLDAALKETS